MAQPPAQDGQPAAASEPTPLVPQPVPAALNDGPAQEPASGNNTATKSGAKKEAKRLEKLAQKAAKAGNKPAAPPAAGAGAGSKERKAKAEKEKAAQEEEEVYVNTTPEGEKKDVSGNMSKSAYNPLAVESAWYAWWQAEGFFQPRYEPTPDNPLGLERDGGRDQQPRKEGVFVIPQPPPNVTGALHTGHALGAAVQDTLIRWNRMRGLTVLHNPGYDHAGISTQSVVENRLLKSEGKSRHDYGRDAFLEKVWEWKEVYQKRITAQTTRIGTSSDWNRVAFTMDENLSRAVKEAFCGLHEKGLLYRANRLVNWCVKLSTTLSNLEVDQKELTGRTMLSVPGYDPKEKFEFGAITSFAYPIENSDERIIVATTRPETLLGDTAIAVHPDDPRYTHLHGKFAVHPFIDRRIPIITDPVTVDMAFGTGAVKITPAHDPNDYECGKRHNLEFINLMNDDGTYNHNAGPQFQGMKRFHIRTKIIETLKEKGLYVETKDNAMQIPVCSKSGDIIEQVMKPQWWVNCQPLAQECLKRFDAGELTIQPKTSERVWYRWMENVQDWCISRQLWWGHRCPAYLIKYEGEDVDASNDANWVIGRTEQAAREQAEKLAKGRKFELEQDDDVLDTWFSSGLWPFSIMGWPNQTPDLDKFYPASLLETGWDIIPFWVARMQMFGIAFTGKMPFKEVYCHGMVRDAEGRKMSKSLGNVVDPLDLIEGCTLEALAQQLRQGNLPEKEIIRAEEGQRKLFPKGIPQCGTDALRFALVNYCTGGLDVLLKVDDVAGYRKFCNKLWNATKFCMVKLGLMDFEGVRLQNDFIPQKTGARTGNESLCERWILHKLNLAAKNINTALERRSFYDATESMHAFWLYELCDVFIEATKPLTTADAPAEVRESALNTIYTCLESALRLIHPVMPFVSEDLWQRLPRRPEENAKSIMVCEYPQDRPDYHDPEAERDFDLVLSCIKSTRSLFALYSLPTNGKTAEDKHEMLVQVADTKTGDMLASQAPIVEALVKGCRGIKVVRLAEEVPAGCATEAINADVTVHILVKGKVNAADEIAKLEKKAGLAKTSAEKVKKLESQPNYESTIPAEVRAKNAERLRDLEAEVENLRLAIEKFQSLA